MILDSVANFVLYLKIVKAPRDSAVGIVGRRVSSDHAGSKYCQSQGWLRHLLYLSFQLSGLQTVHITSSTSRPGQPVISRGYT